MPAQPQAQLEQALGAAREALAAEPELEDKATLRHAINLLQRVHDKNKREQTGGSAPPKPAKSTYAQIASRHS